MVAACAGNSTFSDSNACFKLLVVCHLIIEHGFFLVSPLFPLVKLRLQVFMNDPSAAVAGCRSARDKDWYASPLWGKSQAELCMPLEDPKQRGKLERGAAQELPDSNHM